MNEKAREERIKMKKFELAKQITQLVEDLSNIPLTEGVDKNSWLFAGCVQDLRKAESCIMDYIERCLR